MDSALLTAWSSLVFRHFLNSYFLIKFASLGPQGR